MKTILVVGDSLSAAYQMDERQGWVALLEEKLQKNHSRWRIRNASISGDTTDNGLNRLPPLLVDSPDILIIELGANDGLQGKSFASMEQNLTQMIAIARDHARIQNKVIHLYLSEIHLPANLGSAFGRAFNRIFHTLAQREKITLIPFSLETINAHPEYIQSDGLHPSPLAQPLIMDNVYQSIVRDLD